MSGRNRPPGSRRSKYVGTASGARLLDENGLYDLLDQLAEPPLLLILDSVQDPHNLGACLRVADGAGVHAVVVPKDRAATITDTVRNISAGAADYVPFAQVTNLVRTMKELQGRGIWLMGTSDGAERSIYEHDLTGSLGLVMGSEGSGLRRLVEETCDFLASIPMHGHVSSLNVSVATGICLYEARRQRLLRK